MKHTVTIGSVLLVVLIGLGVFWFTQDSPKEQLPQKQTTEPLQPESHPNLIIDTMLASPLTSPLTLTGKARLWYFEGSFPVSLRDAHGTVVAQNPAQAQGEWMTTDFVPFIATLEWKTRPTTATGTLLFRKDNPSGDPERDEQYEIPIRFYE